MRGAVDTVKAGGDGRFEFSALGQGSFTLVASAPAHQEAMQDVELRLGMETPVAITLPDGVLLAGKVVGPGGAAVPNAKVAARPWPRRRRCQRRTARSCTRRSGGPCSP